MTIVNALKNGQFLMHCWWKPEMESLWKKPVVSFSSSTPSPFSSSSCHAKYAIPYESDFWAGTPEK
jgi:hypothetical protein